MTATATDLTLAYAAAIRNLVNSVVGKIPGKGGTASSTRGSLKRRLRLKDDDDWGRLCASMDLLGDTALAIQNFERFGIDGPTRYGEVGEKYLRLYGLLNAVYLQQSAALSLYNLFNVPQLKRLRAKFKALDITQLRHKIAAHTLDYVASEDSKPDSFIIVRCDLGETGVHLQSYLDGKSETRNLLALFSEYTKILLDSLDQIYEKAIRTIYRTAQAKRTQHLEKLNVLRLKCKGAVVVETPEQMIVIEWTAS